MGSLRRIGLVGSERAYCPGMGIPVILDTDNSFGLPGSDVGDGLALMCLLGSRTVDLLGVTTAFGAAPADVAYRETRRLLALLDREEVPVFHGAPWPGYRATEAAHFLAKSARARPGELTIVATGPLANLAAASEVSRTFFPELGRVICAGGSIGKVRVGWRRVREHAFSLDPAAAHAVLGSRRPVAVLSAEICAQSVWRPRDFAQIAWPVWARRAVREWMYRAIIRGGSLRLPLWDVRPAAYLLRPQLFEDRTRSCISTTNDLARGSLRLAERASGGAVNVPVRIRSAEALRAQLLELLDAAMARAPRG